MLPEKLMRPLFGATVLVTVTMALLPKPPKLVIDRFGDKFEHMLAFAVLAVLATLAFRRASPWRVLERLSFLGALIEVFQSIPALHRDCDPKDWLADTLAAGLVLLVIQQVRRSMGQKRESLGYGKS